MSRRRARRIAVEALYAADVRGCPGSDVLDERASGGEAVPAYARDLVEGVSAHRERVDATLADHSPHWPVGRMSAVDRNVLRVAAFELLAADVPSAVVIDEAVELAKRFSGEDAGRFVNGVLGGILSSGARA